jgi:hypothetical protein
MKILAVCTKLQGAVCENTVMFRMIPPGVLNSMQTELTTGGTQFGRKREQQQF